MRNRHVFHTFLVLTSLALMPTHGLSSDGGLSIEEAEKVASKLMQSLGPAYACEMTNVSIEDVSASDEEPNIYFVSYDAFGLRCDAANKLLNERGRPNRIWFRIRSKSKQIDKVPVEPNLDLIHDVDPQVDVLDRGGQREPGAGPVGQLPGDRHAGAVGDVARQR